MVIIATNYSMQSHRKRNGVVSILDIVSHRGNPVKQNLRNLLWVSLGFYPASCASSHVRMISRWRVKS